MVPGEKAAGKKRAIQSAAVGKNILACLAARNAKPARPAKAGSSGDDHHHPGSLLRTRPGVSVRIW